MITVGVKWDDVLSREHFNAECVVSEVDPDLQHSELRHGDGGLLCQPLPVVLGDQLVRAELGQPQHEVHLAELVIVDPLNVQTAAVSEEILAQYLQRLVYCPDLILKFLPIKIYID